MSKKEDKILLAIPPGPANRFHFRKESDICQEALLLPANTSPGGFTNNAQEPSTVVKDDALEVWFVGLGLSLPDEPIDAPGQEITINGLGRAELDENLRELSRSDGPFGKWVNITEVRRVDGSLYLLYTTIRPNDWHRSERIVVRRSEDTGITWSKRDLMLAPDRRIPFVN
jgi:hypothetical protein